MNGVIAMSMAETLGVRLSAIALLGFVIFYSATLSARTAFADATVREPTVVAGVDNQTLFRGELRPTLVTASSAGTPGINSIAPGASIPGYAGFQHEGVGRIETAGNALICSAGLLTTGRHVLTAAHCFDAMTASETWSINFDLTAGVESATFGRSDVRVHNSYSDTAAGFDVAVITLDTPLPISIPRYDVIGSGAADVMDAAHLRIGYGESGDGGTGATLAAGDKRWGENRWEANGLSALVSNEPTHLTYDFDSGATSQDAFGFFFGTTGPIGTDASANDAQGEGETEVIGANGDSGAPIFVPDGAGDFVIAGVASYVARLAIISSGATSDIDTSLNSSFGEFGGDARVAHPEVSSFISSVTSVPEPSPLIVMTLLFAVAGAIRHRWGPDEANA